MADDDVITVDSDYSYCSNNYKKRKDRPTKLVPLDRRETIVLKPGLERVILQARMQFQRFETAYAPPQHVPSLLRRRPGDLGGFTYLWLCDRYA